MILITFIRRPLFIFARVPNYANFGLARQSVKVFIILEIHEVFENL